MKANDGYNVGQTNKAKQTTFEISSSLMERRVTHALNMYSHLAHLVRVQLLANLALHIRRQDPERGVLVRPTIVVRLAVRRDDLDCVQKVDAPSVHAVSR